MICSGACAVWSPTCACRSQYLPRFTPVASAKNWVPVHYVKKVVCIRTLQVYSAVWPRNLFCFQFRKLTVDLLPDRHQYISCFLASSTRSTAGASCDVTHSTHAHWTITNAIKFVLGEDPAAGLGWGWHRCEWRGVCCADLNSLIGCLYQWKQLSFLCANSEDPISVCLSCGDDQLSIRQLVSI